MVNRYLGYDRLDSCIALLLVRFSVDIHIHIYPLVVKHWRQPARHLRNTDAFALGQRLYLIVADFPSVNVLGVWMGVVPAADRCCGRHGKALGQPDASY